MYSFNLENIVPIGGLACLIAKATTDESNKWHRRLGRVNFKNLNKLVKENLVRGLPSKIFQNEHTCVACQKGKQHKASCKAKAVSSISQTLQLLRMKNKPVKGDQAKEIQDLKAQIAKLKKQAKPVIKHHKAWLKSVSLKQRFPRKSFSKKHRVHKESVSKQGRKFAKGKSSVQRDPLFDELPEDTIDHMETENAKDEGRTREVVDKDKEIEENVLSTEDVLSTDKDKVSTDKEKVSTYRPIVSTDRSKVSTDRQNEGTEEKNEGIEEKNEGTEEHIEGTEENFEGTEEQVESTDGHKKAKVLLNMSQAKAVSREKEKGIELKDIEEADRPRPTSTRSLLTLKHLPKIDPKDKGKKKIEEEDESES
ncbi:putative ribonuclease H-like domain-containing protein, partial [Tanacetum coccineum]